MSQYLESYDMQRRRTAVLPNAYDIIETKPLNGIWQLEFKLPGGDEKARYLDARRLVRYQDGELYRIVDWATTTTDVESVTYKCEHVLAALSDRIMPGEVSVENVSTSQVLRTILNYQRDWVLGECDFAYQYGYAWTSETLLNAIWSVPNCFTDAVKIVTDTTSYPWRLSFKKINTDGKPDSIILAGLNFLQSRRTSKHSTLCTRVYPKGYGEGVNQLDIKKINGGKAYINAPADVIERYGIIEREYVDRSIQDAQQLYNVAYAYLMEACRKLEEYAIDAADVYAMTGNPMHKPEPGDVMLFQPDDYRTYVTEVKTQHDKPGDLKLKLANKPSDLADMLTDIANKARIESTYAQGSTILWGGPLCGNADGKNALKYPLWMPRSIIHANVVRVKIELSRFRTDSKGIKSGGGTARTTSSNGGSTYTSTTDAQMNEVITSYQAWTSSPLSIRDKSELLYTDNSGRLQTKEGGGGNTKGASAEWTGYSSVTGSHRHYHPHIHALDVHSHAIEGHIHEYNHLHSVEVIVKIPGKPGHAHKVTVGAHSHQVEIPDHIHEQNYGIFTAGEMPSTAAVKINGKSAFSMERTWEGEITSYLIEDNGEIARGKFVNIEVLPNINAFITIVVAAQAFISGKEGGKY